MPTDPARVRRTDPGDPEKCPVWQLHKVYSSAETRDWVVKGCTTAGIGCLDCKQPVIDAMIKEQEPWRERAQPYLDDPVAAALDRRRRLRSRPSRRRGNDARRARRDGPELQLGWHACTRPEAPSAWVERFAHLVPAGARVLDLACGRGRHARFFAARGCQVDAVDRDPQLRPGAAPACCACVSSRPTWRNGALAVRRPRCSTRIVVTNYLHRPLFPRLLSALAPRRRPALRDLRRRQRALRQAEQSRVPAARPRAARALCAACCMSWPSRTAPVPAPRLARGAAAGRDSRRRCRPQPYRAGSAGRQRGRAAARIPAFPQVALLHDDHRAVWSPSSRRCTRTGASTSTPIVD